MTENLLTARRLIAVVFVHSKNVDFEIFDITGSENYAISWVISSLTDIRLILCSVYIFRSIGAKMRLLII